MQLWSLTEPIPPNLDGLTDSEGHDIGTSKTTKFSNQIKRDWDGDRLVGPEPFSLIEALQETNRKRAEILGKKGLRAPPQ